MARHDRSVPARFLPVAALLLALVVAVGPVAAAAPTVTANPALVPFSPVPGQPGTTTLTFAANGTAGLTACGQDNRILPAFRLGAVDPNTPLVINFPYIQAGVYNFWVSADATCDPLSELAAANATRVGPTGKAGADDIAFRPNFGEQSIAPDRTWPIKGEQLCIMSGDGATVTANVVVGQDPRLYGAGSNHIVVTPFAGQNGCYDVPWIVTGSTGRASAARPPSPRTSASAATPSGRT